MKTSPHNPLIGFKLLLSACARRAGKTALLTAAVLGLASSGYAQLVTDFGATAPTAGPNDIYSQLTTGGSDLGGTFYVDTGNPGQSFTTLSDRPTYPLTSVYIHMRSTGGSSSPIATTAYTLRIYTMTNPTALTGTAIVTNTYTTTNSTTLVQGDWVKISGLTNILNAGTNYGFALSRVTGVYWEPDFTSSSVYAGGAAIRFKTTTGTLNTVNTGNDMVFLLGLSMTVAPTTFSPISPVWTNAPVTLSAPVTGGAAPLTYNWQVSTDLGVTYNNLGVGNGSPTYSLNPANMGGTTNYYRLIVSDSEATPLIATNTGSALVISATPVPPVVLANTTLTPSSIYLGGSSTMSATIGGSAPLSYQWQYTNNNGGSLVNIPGATNTTYILTNALSTSAGSYRLSAINSVEATNTSFATLTVLPTMIISDFGVTAPTPNADGNDIAQLSNSGTTVSPAGLYSFDDHASAPGQTFTTGSSAGGYSLASVYMKFGVTGNSGNAAGLGYTLRIYNLTNAYAGTNGLLATYTNQNIAPAFAAAGGHWVQWYGPFTNVLAPNKVYAYSLQQSSGYMMQDDASGNVYPGGQQVNIGPANGTPTYGTAGTSSNYDLTFMVSLAPAGGYPKVQTVSMSLPNGSSIFAGAPVTMYVTAIGGNPLGYVWQSDNQTAGVTFTPLPNSNSTQYSLDTSVLTPGTYQFNVLATNSLGTNASSSMTLVVQAAVIQTVSIAPTNSPASPVYAGTPVTLSSTVLGNNLTYYWQTDGGLGGGFSNIPSSNTNVFAINTSAMTPGTYLYDLMVSNSSGTVTSSQLTLNLVAASGPVLLTGTTYAPSAVVIVGNTVTANGSFTGSQPITYQWQHAGTNIPSATNTSYPIATAQLTDAGTYTLVASNNPPGIGPTTTGSTANLLYVVNPAQTNNANAIFADGGASPFVGSYDIAQLLDENGTLPTRGGAAGTINYYVNAIPTPGQTFTTSNTPPTSAGYPLNYVYLKNDPTGTGVGASTSQGYNLRVYQMLDATNAQLLTSYFTTNVATFTVGDWVRIGGLTNMLKTNTTYAFALQSTNGTYWKVAAHVSSPDDYVGGQSVLLPALSGLAIPSYPDINFGFSYDAAFVAGMTPASAPVELAAMFINPNSIHTGQGPVVMTASFIGSIPVTYQWKHAGTNLPGATGTTYTIPAVNSAQDGTYVCLASNSYSAGTPTASTSQYLTVDPTVQTGLITSTTRNGSFELISGVPGTGKRNISTGTVDNWTTWPAFPNSGDTGTDASGAATDGTRVAFLQGNSGIYNTAGQIIQAGDSYSYTWDWVLNGRGSAVVQLGYWDGTNVVLIPGTDSTAPGGNTGVLLALGTNYMVLTNDPAIGHAVVLTINAPSGANYPEVDNINLTVVPAGTGLAPFLVSDTAITPASSFVGGTVVMSASFNGTAPLRYQWSFNNGGGAVPIAGATNSTYTIASASLGNSGTYYLTATNAYSPYTASSSAKSLQVFSSPQANTTGAGLFDATGTAPTAGAYDIAQLVTASPTVVPVINYYVDNGNPPGQTFTTLGAFTNGYQLHSVYLQEDVASDGGGGLNAGTYRLGIYAVTGSNTVLLTSYDSTNQPTLTAGNWMQWIGLTNVLATNQTYAFSMHKQSGGGYWKLAANSTASDLYSGGRSVLLPNSGLGTLAFSSDATIDAGFLIGLSSVSTVATNPTNITSSVSGNLLTLSWPADHTGWRLQVQTNAVSAGLQSNWVDVPGSTSVNSINITINPASGAVFYRMVYP